MYLCQRISTPLKYAALVVAATFLIQGLAVAAAPIRGLVPVAPRPLSTNTTVPTLQTVLDNIEANFANIVDISGTVKVEQVQVDGSVIEARAEVQAILAGVLRMTFLEPETFADSIFVFDKSSNTAIQYSPVTEQAIEQSIDKVLTDNSMFTSVEQLFSLPSPEDYQLTVIGTEVKDSRNLVLISAEHKRNPDNLQYKFWVNRDKWLVDSLQVFDCAGKLQFTVQLSDVKLNQNLQESTLKRMPGRTQIIRR